MYKNLRAADSLSYHSFAAHNNPKKRGMRLPLLIKQIWFCLHSPRPCSGIQGLSDIYFGVIIPHFPHPFPVRLLTLFILIVFLSIILLSHNVTVLTLSLS